MLSDIEEGTRVVIDAGTWRTRVGVCGDDHARHVFRTSSEGRTSATTASARRRSPIEKSQIVNWDDMESLFRYMYTDKLKLSIGGDEPPVRSGQTLTAADYGVMLSESVPNSTRYHREKTAQVFFEEFGVYQLSLQSSAALSMYASGRCHGIVLDSGCGSTSCVPVYEGHPISHGVEFSDVLSGKALTDLMWQLLLNDGTSGSLDQQHQTGKPVAQQEAVACFAKEGYCRLATRDFAREFTNCTRPGYVGTSDKQRQEMWEDWHGEEMTLIELPDGSSVFIRDRVALACPEFLFYPWPRALGRYCTGTATNTPPGLDPFSSHDEAKARAQDVELGLGGSWKSIPEMVAASISRCTDSDLHCELWSSVVLAGGNTLFPNFKQRLQFELDDYLATSTGGTSTDGGQPMRCTSKPRCSCPTLHHGGVLRSHVIAAPDRKQSMSWIGGSIISSMNSQNQKFTEKREYDEVGPSILHQRCQSYGL